MANHMETYITVRSDNKQVAQYLDRLFGGNNIGTIQIVNAVFATEFTWDKQKTRQQNLQQGNTWPDLSYMSDNVGSKWVEANFEYDDNPENCHLTLTSAWSVPQQLLITLAQQLYVIDPHSYLVGSYEDESFDPSGAFVAAVNYFYMEDIQDEFYHDLYDADDLYLEKWRDQYIQLQDELEEDFLT